MEPRQRYSRLIPSFPSPFTPALSATLGLTLEAHSDVQELLARLENLHQAVHLLGQVHRDVSDSAVTLLRDLHSRIVALFLAQVMKVILSWFGRWKYRP